VWDRVFIGSDGVRPHLGERLEFSHGLVAALGESLTLRSDSSPAIPTSTRHNRLTRAEHGRRDGKIGRDGDSAAVTLPLPTLFS
jgi:hypothetical protein